MLIKHGKSLVAHHIYYKEIHGYDKVKLMTRSEHKNLHSRLRREGLCNVSVVELGRISKAAESRRNREIRVKYNKEFFKDYNKTNIKQKSIYRLNIKEVEIRTLLQFNFKTEHIGIGTYFSPTSTERRKNKGRD